MQDKLQRALNVAKKTGDRLIIFDASDGDEAYVVMNLSEYERIVQKNIDVRNLTEDEMLDRINRDIVEWRSDKSEFESIEDFEEDYTNNSEMPYSFKDEEINNEYAFDGGEEDYDDRDEISQYLEKYTERFPYNNEVLENKNAENKGNKRRWSIPEERKEAAEEVIEEDRQYLEEITF